MGQDLGPQDDRTGLVDAGYVDLVDGMIHYFAHAGMEDLTAAD